MKRISQNTAEKMVLGAIIYEGLRGITFLRPTDFKNKKNRLIFEAMKTLSRKHKRIDYLNLVKQLRKEKPNNLDRAGGLHYVTSIHKGVPINANGAFYARLMEFRANKAGVARGASSCTGGTK